MEINALEETQSVTDLSGANLTGANLTGANLTGANLTEVNLDGVVLCNTTMPDGRVNNSGCKT